MELGLIGSQETTASSESKAVTRPNRVIWSICEDDVLSIARNRGLELTEPQLDYVARYVERGLSAVCNWFMLVEMGLDEARE